jgi:hypothetical protein
MKSKDRHLTRLIQPTQKAARLINGVQTVSGGERAFVVTSLGREAIKYFNAGNN